MKIGISTACFYPNPLEQSFARIASLGLRAVEIFFNTESEICAPFTDEMAQLLRENGLELISVHPFTSLMEGILLFSDYSRRTEDGFEQYRRYFAAAAALGAKYLTLHGERRMPGLVDSPAAYERRIERYHRLCRTAAEEGVLVAQENVAWCRSSDPEFLRMLRENVPELHYTLDIKQAHRAGKNWRDYLDVIAPRLVNVHINDYDEEHSCLLPGEGLCDYGELFGALRNAGYDGQTLIEVYSSNFSSDEQIVSAVQTLRTCARAAGYKIEDEA